MKHTNNRYFAFMCIATFAMLFIIGGCKTIRTDRGRVEDDLTITLTGMYPADKGAPLLPFSKPVVLKPNTFFDLSNYKLNANRPHTSGKICTASGYKTSGIITYEAKLQGDGGKTYYGRIAFFDPLAKAASKAVTSYYKVTFTQKLAEASDGRTAFYYEYYDIGAKIYPTWIMWASDAPLK